MEEKELITRRSESGNRRSLHVYLTDKGREYIPLIKDVIIKHESNVFTGISVSERAAFISTLTKILNNLADTEELQ